MKFSLLFFFFASLIFLDAEFLQFGNGSNDTVILDEFNKSSGGTFGSNKSGQYLDEVLLGEELSADTKLNGVGYKDDEGNVLFTGKDGPINLTLNNLAFGFCSTCKKIFHICYDTYEPNGNLKGACPLSTQCELKIVGKSDMVKIGEASVGLLTNFTKLEPGESRKSQKKVAGPKKEATKEPTTTEEFVPTPPPKFTESAPPDPSKPEPKLPQGYYPFIPRIIPKSYKSLKTDSLEETIKKNKVTPVESVVESVRRNCLKDSDSSLVKEMKQKYPEVSRPLLLCEIKLLCIPISKMFTEMNQMARESEENLAALGVQFDSVYRIVIMTPEGRKYLQNSKTSTVVYFAFGAEFHEVVTDDMKVMPKFSMAHLFVIALQPRFEEYHRRKALTWLRRDLPKIRGNYSADERKSMPFPINAIEKAFVLDPKYFLSLRGIDTDSEGDRKRRAEAKAKQKNENGGKNGDLKGKKKKPTKKRD